MSSRATLRFAKVSPQKARLVASLVRGMDVPEALEVLTFTRKKSAPMVYKLVESAVANATVAAERAGTDFDEDELFIEVITVDAGPSLRRFRPRAQGRATRIQKKTAHITVILGTR